MKPPPRKLKRIKLVIDGYPPDIIDFTEDDEISEEFNDMEDDIEGELNNTFNNSTKKGKKRCDVLLDSILLSKKKYRKAFNKLKSRERLRRIDYFSVELIAACIDGDTPSF